MIGYENYGLILPNDDSAWVTIINQFLIDKKDDIQILTKKYITIINIIPPPSTPSISQSIYFIDDNSNTIWLNLGRLYVLG